MNDNVLHTLSSAAAIVVTDISEERLRTAAPGSKVCVPIKHMRDLYDALERQQPGLLRIAYRIAAGASLDEAIRQE